MVSLINPHLQKFTEFIKELPRVPPKDKRANVYDAALGNWVVDENMADAFLDAYNDVIESGVTLNTYERADLRGFFVDLDIIQNVKTQVYPIEFFHEITKSIFQVMQRTLPGITGPARLVITRRAEVTADDEQPGKYKDGAHILFPSLRMNKSLRVHLMDAIKAEFVDIVDDIITSNEQFGNIATISDPASWVDTHAARVPVNLPGSCKPGHTKKPHRIEYTGELALMGSRRRGAEATLKPVAVDNIAAFSALVLKAAGMIYEEFKMDIGPAIPPEVDASLDAADDEKIDADNFCANHAEAAYMRELVNILPPKYYDEYDQWVRVLAALSSMGQRYRSIALEFSKRSKKFDSASFETTWMSVSHSGRTAAEGSLTKRSIIYWARLENPAKFNLITEKSYYTLMVATIMSTNGKFTHSDHSKMLSSLMSHKFVFAKKVAGSRASNPCWFEFITPEDSHRYGEVWKWRADPDGDFLGIYLMETYKQILRQGKMYIEEQKNKVNSKTELDKFKSWEKIASNFDKTISDIGDEGHITKIIKNAQRVFKRREFFDDLDKAEDFIGVANGVLHVGPRVSLIARHHEHPISVATKAAYHPYDPSCPVTRRIEEIFRQVYPEKDVYDYVWFMAATGLDRRPVTGKMFFIVGGGSNGKSITMSFIQNALGLALCASMKMALLTAKNANKANEADSAFMQAKGKTLLVFDEGSGNDILNSEKVKNMVNCNAQTARELFSIQENFFLHANSFCSTNHFPIIRSSDTDYGFWRRVLFYTAKSKFVEDPDPKKPHEHKVDSEIEANLIKDPVYLNATLSIMAHYYERLCNEYGRNINKVPCPTIITETQKFREGQDKSYKYCVERIILSPESVMSASDLGVDYSNWAMTQFNDHIVASKAEEYLSTSVLAKYKSGSEYYGIRVRTSPVRKSKGEMAYGKYKDMTLEDQAAFDVRLRELVAEKEEREEREDKEDERDRENEREEKPRRRQQDVQSAQRDVLSAQRDVSDDDKADEKAAERPKKKLLKRRVADK